MKKNFKYYIGIWSVLFVLFNVIAFISPGWITHDKYTSSFWIGYIFITLAFVGQLFCAKLAFKEENLKKLFYNIPLATISFSGLIISFIVGGACMLISPLPYWVGIIAGVAVLGITAISVLKAKIAIDEVVNTDDKIKEKTLFIKALTVDAKSLLDRAESETIKEQCKKVYEAVRYSDPMSESALRDIETEITVKFSDFSEAVLSQNNESVDLIGKELVILLKDRNNKCKILK